MILASKVNLNKTGNPEDLGNFLFIKSLLCVQKGFPNPMPFFPTYISNNSCNSKQFKFPDQISDLKILNAIYHIKEKEKSIPFMFYILWIKY